MTAAPKQAEAVRHHVARMRPSHLGRHQAPVLGRDQGMTYIELLVAIVLLGTLGLAVLTTLRVTVTGTQLERDHSRALQWLQSASAVVQGTNRVSCEPDPMYATGEEKVRTEYEHAIRIQVANPPGWQADQLRIVPPVKVWDGSQFLDPATAPQPCYDAANKRLQLITIEVTDASGEIIESIDVVKSEGAEATP